MKLPDRHHLNPSFAQAYHKRRVGPRSRTKRRPPKRPHQLPPLPHQFHAPLVSKDLALSTFQKQHHRVIVSSGTDALCTALFCTPDQVPRRLIAKVLQLTSLVHEPAQPLPLV
jgi:hypothetical protein